MLKRETVRPQRDRRVPDEAGILFTDEDHEELVKEARPERPTPFAGFFQCSTGRPEELQSLRANLFALLIR
jgi:hypothetical protein